MTISTDGPQGMPEGFEPHKCKLTEAKTDPLLNLPPDATESIKTTTTLANRTFTAVNELHNARPASPSSVLAVENMGELEPAPHTGSAAKVMAPEKQQARSQENANFIGLLQDKVDFTLGKKKEPPLSEETPNRGLAPKLAGIKNKDALIKLMQLRDQMPVADSDKTSPSQKNTSALAALLKPNSLIGEDGRQPIDGTLDNIMPLIGAEDKEEMQAMLAFIADEEVLQLSTRDVIDLKDAIDQASVQTADSVDMGGHGGTMKLTCTDGNGETKRLFLKPYDQAEARHYDAIETVSPGLLEFMPRVYGKVEVDGKSFLVMDNSRLNEQGGDVGQVADVKLSGRVKGLGNPIASMEEVKATGRKKSGADYKMMSLTAVMAGDYQFITGKNKLTRFFNFAFSKRNLQSSLKEKGVTKQDVADLKNQLEGLKATLTESNFGMIGASVIILKEKGQRAKIQLIDPAHIQFGTKAQAKLTKEWKGESQAHQSDRDAKQLYFGSEERKSDLTGDDLQMDLYKDSNGIAIDGLIKSLDEYEKKAPSEEG